MRQNRTQRILRKASPESEERTCSTSGLNGTNMANYMYLTHTHTHIYGQRATTMSALDFVVVGAFALAPAVGNATQNNDKYNNYGQKRQQRCH